MQSGKQKGRWGELFVQVFHSLFNHPKTLDFASRLGNPPLVWAHLVLIWAWAQRCATAGRFKVDATQISKIAEWTGDPAVFLTALLDSGFFEKSGEKFRIHDWEQHSGAINIKRRKDIERHRIQGTSTEDPRQDVDVDVDVDLDGNRERETDPSRAREATAPSGNGNSAAGELRVALAGAWREIMGGPLPEKPGDGDTVTDLLTDHTRDALLKSWRAFLADQKSRSKSSPFPIRDWAPEAGKWAARPAALRDKMDLGDGRRMDGDCTTPEGRLAWERKMGRTDD